MVLRGRLALWRRSILMVYADPSGIRERPVRQVPVTPDLAVLGDRLSDDSVAEGGSEYSAHWCSFGVGAAESRAGLRVDAQSRRNCARQPVARRLRAPCGWSVDPRLSFPSGSDTQGPFDLLLAAGALNARSPPYRDALSQRPTRRCDVPSSFMGEWPEDVVPLEGLEPPTVSLGRNCSSIELQRLARRVYRSPGVR